MAIAVTEKFKGHTKLDGKSAERIYYISGTDDASAARDAMMMDPNCPAVLTSSVYNVDANGFSTVAT
ncbi:MAG: hypothetical protein ACRYGG_22370, partial [Janthinobacterium lividum]